MRTEILPLATSHIAIAHLCNQFNHVFALLMSMPHFKSINFIKTGLILFLQNNKVFCVLRAPPLDPNCLRRIGAELPDPQHSPSPYADFYAPDTDVCCSYS